MRHCLVTGGAGFIGSHLAEALIARSARVTVIDDESTGAPDNLARLSADPRFRYLKGSVADRELLGPLVAAADEVYHLAAAVGVDLVVREPIHTIRTNIGPTDFLLDELCRHQEAGRPKRLFLASSSEVYGKNPKPVFREDDDLVFGPTDHARWSYGVSKAIDEMLALACWQRSRLPVVIGRLFNVVGPRQRARQGFVLPRFLAAALAGGPLAVYGNGRQVRSFLHVADAVAAILALVENPASAGAVVNIGSDQPVTILELAEQVVDAVDRGLKIEFRSYREAYGQGFEECPRRVPDLARLRSLVALRPRRELREIIAETLAWRRSSA